MKLRFGTLTIGTVLLTAASLSAQTTLVSWGPSSTLMDIGTGNSQRTSSAGGLDFDLTTPISPLAFNPGNGRTYSGTAYYGGVASANPASMSAGIAIRNAAFGNGNDAQIFGISLTAPAVVANGYTATGVFLWKQQDFLAGSSVTTDNVTITSLSYDGLLLNGAGVNLEGRFVLQQGSSYLISSSLGLATFSQVRSLTNLSSVSWYSYTPTGRSIGTAAIGSEVLSPTFSGVTAAGLYLTGESQGSGSAFILAFSQFTASGTVSAIPEPSAAAALVGLAGLAMAASRRRRT